MSILKILKYPDKRLRKIANPVTSFDSKLKKLTEDMAETMYDAPGIGLAATQVDVHLRVIVIDISKERNNLITIINPTIQNKSNDFKKFEEGCLSVPGIFEEVSRADKIDLTYFDVYGKKIELTTDGLLAVCIQHEMDHLIGKVFVDHLSRLKQDRITKKIIKGKISTSGAKRPTLSETLA